MAENVPLRLAAPDTSPGESDARSSRALLLLVGALLLVGSLGILDGPLRVGTTISYWATLFVAVLIQALPFLVLGVLLSGAVAAFVSPRLLERLLPRRETSAIGAASCAGFLLPGCECGSVPIAGRLVSRGVVPSAALAFMLAAPAINPIVIVSTSVAFPGEPRMVVARITASFLTAIIVGMVWGRTGAATQLIQRLKSRPEPTGDRLEVFASVARHDLLHAGGFLVIGAAVAAAAQSLVPRQLLETLAGSLLVSIAIMTLLAIILSICSEADAFVASGFAPFPRIALLAFMVTGPAVDLKLISMQLAVFGRRFVVRFVPLTLFIALSASLSIGWAIL